MRSRRGRNAFLLLASYVFYGCWDWRFLGLIAFSTVVDFSVALAMPRSDSIRHRRWLLAASVLTNLGLLATFKYYGFFYESFQEMLAIGGLAIESSTLSIVLPVGISFYTFQTMSYTIDVYRGRMKPTKDWVAFATYVAFFPQLVAGPIERASNLLPQFSKNRKFSDAQSRDGLRLILWGLFKKVVIADGCGIIADYAFEHAGGLFGLALILGIVAFAFQIYGDFSGYSEIAIGTAKLFGIELMQNFSVPYFSRDIAEFWRRWHISLTTWFRDYVYVPMGGSRVSKQRTIANVAVVFLLSGLWHGAAWTFVLWGLMNALFFVFYVVTEKNRRFVGQIACARLLPTPAEFIRMVSTFGIVCCTWVLFRADSLSSAVLYYKHMLIWPEIDSAIAITTCGMTTQRFVSQWVLVGFLLTIEWVQRGRAFALQRIHTSAFVRWILYLLIGILILLFWGEPREFIYFQF